MQLQKMAIIARTITRNRGKFSNLSDLSLADLNQIVTDFKTVIEQLEAFDKSEKLTLDLQLPVLSNFTLSEFANTLSKPLRDELDYRKLQLSIFDGEHLE